MKICIYYYSGAGNTECISEILQHVLQTEGHNVYRKRITKKTIETAPEKYELLAIGFPVYFRRAPLLVLDFIGRQIGNKRKFFSFCTKGLYSGDAAKEIQALATEQSFHHIGHLEFYMPGSDALALMARKKSLSEKFFKAIHSRNIKKRIEKFIRSINDHEKIEKIRSKWYTPLDNRIVKPLEHHFTDNYQIFFDRFVTNQVKCTLCLHCVKTCPNANISVAEGTVQFGSVCSFCLRCLHQCPEEAIDIKDKTEDKVKYHPKITKDLLIDFDNK